MRRIGLGAILVVAVGCGDAAANAPADDGAPIAVDADSDAATVDADVGTDTAQPACDPAGSCSALGRSCADPSTLVTCAKDADGCLRATSQPCGMNQTCTPTGVDAACVCKPDPTCTVAGPTCGDSTTLVSCALDAQGCPVASGSMACGDLQICTGAAGVASCGCVTPSVCPVAGPACQDASTLVQCTANSLGCLSATSPTKCDATERCLGGACGCNPTLAPDPATGVFVSATGGSDATGLGTTVSPYATISKAIAAAQSAAVPNVYVAPGIYHESLALTDSPVGVFVQGGWIVSGTIWLQDCDANAKNATDVRGGAIAVRATDLSHASGLRQLTIHTQATGDPTPSGLDGASLIGVFVTGASSKLTLDQVAILSGKAGDGGPGRLANDGVGVIGGGSGASCGDGTSASAPGPAGIAAPTEGTFSASGFTPASGIFGGNGAPGSAGKIFAPTCQTLNTCSAGCGYSSSGPGGTVCGSAGTCGGGGVGGGGGFGGGGGGASVALLVAGSGASVTLRGGTLTAGAGGAGAAGSSGGRGANGTAGSTGSPNCALSYNPVSNGTCSCGFLCTQNYFACQGTQVCGGAGGGYQGGSGGAGGAGGGGAGGPSYAIVTVGAPNVILEGAPSLAFGSGGAGAGGAVAGSARARLDVP
jgi:hypothetical protein